MLVQTIFRAAAWCALIVIASWAASVLIASFVVPIWFGRPWKFGLRDLLIATTVVAAIACLIGYAL